MSATTSKTASAALKTLRDAPAKQAKIYQEYRSKAKKVQMHPYLEAPQRRDEIAKLVTQARNELAELQTACVQAQNSIQQKANTRKIEPDERAQRKVYRAMASGKWTVGELMLQLIKENDRPAIAALRAELPYLARQGRLDGPPNDYHAQIAQANEIINTMEPALFDDVERGLHSEVREATINAPFVGQNAKWINDSLEATLRRQGGPPSRGEGVERLLKWQGLPEDGQDKGYLDLSDPE